MVRPVNDANRLFICSTEDRVASWRKEAAEYGSEGLYEGEEIEHRRPDLAAQEYATESLDEWALGESSERGATTVYVWDWTERIAYRVPVSYRVEVTWTDGTPEVIP